MFASVFSRLPARLRHALALIRAFAFLEDPPARPSRPCRDPAPCRRLRRRSPARPRMPARRCRQRAVQALEPRSGAVGAAGALADDVAHRALARPPQRAGSAPSPAQPLRATPARRRGDSPPAGVHRRRFELLAALHVPVEPHRRLPSCSGHHSARDGRCDPSRPSAERRCSRVAEAGRRASRAPRPRHVRASAHGGATDPDPRRTRTDVARSPAGTGDP